MGKLIRYNRYYDKVRNMDVGCGWMIDTELSQNASELLAKLLLLPENWDVSINNLCSLTKMTKGIINKTIKELKDRKYLFIEKYELGNGWDYKYIVHDTVHPHCDVVKSNKQEKEAIVTDYKIETVEEMKRFNECDSIKELIYYLRELNDIKIRQTAEVLKLSFNNRIEEEKAVEIITVSHILHSIVGNINRIERQEYNKNKENK